MSSYRDLIVWQKAMTLAEAVYKATRTFPKEEMYGLTSQMRRAAVSVPSNIAEGQLRETTGEFLPFLACARGSIGDLDTQATLAERLGMLDATLAAELKAHIDDVARLLTGLRRSLKP